MFLLTLRCYQGIPIQAQLTRPSKFHRLQQYLTQSKARLIGIYRFVTFDIPLLSWNSNSSLVDETIFMPLTRRSRRSFAYNPTKNFFPPKGAQDLLSFQIQCYSSQNHNKKTKLVEGRLLSAEYHTTATHWITQLQSIPNLITLGRMSSAPFLAYWIISGQNDLAFIGCLVACASDAADGFIARRYKMTTTLGTYLDPLCTFLEPTCKILLFLELNNNPDTMISIYSR
jgi:CDP-alcohol phosphatidyltransferase